MTTKATPTKADKEADKEEKTTTKAEPHPETLNPVVTGMPKGHIPLSSDQSGPAGPATTGNRPAPTP